MTREQLEQRLTAILAAARDQLLAAYLFGSVARGTDLADSDVDIGVLLRTTPSDTLCGLRLTLEGELERALGRRVQVVILNTAPPDLAHRVLRDGRLLLDRDRSMRIRFEVRARNLYFDLLPTIRRYRRQEATSS